MKLNHLNLTVTNVSETGDFLEKYFGLQPMGPTAPNAFMAGLRDDNGMILTVMRVGEAAEVNYPGSFHIGFIQESEEQVNEINRRLKDDGFEVPEPRRFHGSWTFYFRSPGGFTIEVLA